MSPLAQISLPSSVPVSGLLDPLLRESGDTSTSTGENQDSLCPGLIVRPSGTGSSSALSAQQLPGSQPRSPASLTPLSLHAAPCVTSSLHGTFLNFPFAPSRPPSGISTPFAHLPPAEIWFPLPKQHSSRCVTMTASPLQARASHRDTRSLQRHRARQPPGIGGQMLTSMPHLRAPLPDADRTAGPGPSDVHCGGDPRGTLKSG